MALTSAERRKVLARARDLSARNMVGKAGLTPAVLGQIRAELQRSGLLKLRLPKDRQEADALVARIESEVPAELVGRLGFTAVVVAPENDE